MNFDEWFEILHQLEKENRRDFTISLTDFEDLLYEAYMNQSGKRKLTVKYYEKKEKDIPHFESYKIVETNFSIYMNRNQRRLWDKLFDKDGKFRDKTL